MMSGLARSFFVMLSIMPCTRLSACSGSSPSGIMSLIPGIREITSFMPILAIISNWLRKSLSVNLPDSSLACWAWARDMAASRK